MTITLELKPEIEQQLAEEAAERGVPVEAYTVTLLEQHLPRRNRAAELEALFDAWAAEGDIEEQSKTGEFLIQALDEDRLSERRLFPPERRGITW